MHVYTYLKQMYIFSWVAWPLVVADGLGCPSLYLCCYCCVSFHLLVAFPCACIDDEPFPLIIHACICGSPLVALVVYVCFVCVWLMVALPSCAYAILSYCALVMLGYILWPWLPFFQLLFWLLCPFFGIGLVLCLYRWWAIPLWLNMHVYAYPLWFLVTCGCLFPCPYVIFPCVTMLWLIYGWVTCGGLSCPSPLLV